MDTEWARDYDKIFSTLKITDFFGWLFSAVFGGDGDDVELIVAGTSFTAASLGAVAEVGASAAGDVGRLTKACEL